MAQVVGAHGHILEANDGGCLNAQGATKQPCELERAGGY